jgi:hypothetical protein
MSRMKEEQARVLAKLLIKVIRFVRAVWEMSYTDEGLEGKAAALLMEIDSEFDKL